MKSAEESMEIRAAFDLLGSLHAAADLAGGRTTPLPGRTPRAPDANVAVVTGAERRSASNNSRGDDPMPMVEASYCGVA